MGNVCLVHEIRFSEMVAFNTLFEILELIPSSNMAVSPSES